MDQKSTYYLLAAVGVLVFGGLVYMVNKNPEVPATTMMDESSEISEKSSSDNLQGTYEYTITEGTVKYVANKVFIATGPTNVEGVNTSVTGSGYFDSATKMGHVEAMFSFSDFSTGNAARDSDLFQNYVSNKDISIIGDFTDLAMVEGTDQNAVLPLNVTINGVSKQVDFNVTYNVTPETLMARGDSMINLVDFGVKTPNMLDVYTVEDQVKINFDVMGSRK
ncbi:MAG: YceI protein [Patescibacteria group bacterium]|nr:YceI protein [Patescibacteria group bacterium]